MSFAFGASRWPTWGAPAVEDMRCHLNLRPSRLGVPAIEEYVSCSMKFYLIGEPASTSFGALQSSLAGEGVVQALVSEPGEIRNWGPRGCVPVQFKREIIKLYGAL